MGKILLSLNSHTNSSSLLKSLTAVAMKIKQKLDRITHPNRRQHLVKYFTSIVLKIAARISGAIVAVQHFLEFIWALL